MKGKTSGVAGLILLGMAMFPLVMGGCQQFQQAEQTELQREAGAIQSVTPIRSDDQIRAEIERLFARDRLLSVELIEFQVEDGVVVLDGMVQDARQVTRAEAEVRGVIGVHRVHNRLKTM